MPRIKSELVIPDDWEALTGYHGFAKVVGSYSYQVTLSCLGKQYFFGRHKSQLSAAREYDAALNLLLPFTSRHAKPNFPLDFNPRNPDNLATNCPQAVELYDKLSKLVTDAGGNVEQLRESRIRGLTDKLTGAVVSREALAQERRLRKFDSLLAHLYALAKEVDSRRHSVNASSVELDLSKLPQCREALENTVRCAESLSLNLGELLNSLRSHRDFYLKVMTGGLNG